MTHTPMVTIQMKFLEVLGFTTHLTDNNNNHFHLYSRFIEMTYATNSQFPADVIVSMPLWMAQQKGLI